jgi:hypothetical protein
MRDARSLATGEGQLETERYLEEMLAIPQ